VLTCMKVTVAEPVSGLQTVEPGVALPLCSAQTNANRRARRR
jgi:hypothetical protein